MTERDDRIAAIRARAEAATGRRWVTESAYGEEGPIRGLSDVIRLSKDDPCRDGGGARADICEGALDADATFIANARSDIPWLLDELARVDTLVESRTMERDDMAKEVERLAGEVRVEREANRTERAAWSTAWSTLTDTPDGQTYAADDVQRAAARMKERALKAESAAEKLRIVLDDWRNYQDKQANQSSDHLKRALAAELRLAQIKNTLNAAISRYERELDKYCDPASGGASSALEELRSDLGFGESPASEPSIESKDERCPTCGQWPEDDYPDSQRDPD